ncbi:OX-2 membrane glycoprotein-like isoform X2 [Leuresthes tenuis]|uniref:OX-2 membrane glycoprotein-like isoform X2 n=1 Tax=Leuresthes tenuis TaxID=355514 RepID=UPI003B5105F3
MLHGVIIFCLLSFGLSLKGVTAVVQTQETVMAEVGGEAHLSCQLRESKEVHQVTWQKLLPNDNKNVASYSQYVGQTVNPGFTDKIEFEEAELQRNSIIIRNLTEEDEGCYRCMFNTFPDGSLTAATCLKVFELHQPLLHVRASDSPEESVVSCSATGRPAPTVTLTVSLQHLNVSHYNTVSVNNTNGTVTVNTTAVLSGICDDSAQVGCAVRVLSGPLKEAFVTIPELKRASADGLDEESGPEHRGFRWPLIFIMVVCACVTVPIILLLRKRAQKRTEEPLVANESIELKHRTPPQGSRENIDPDTIEARAHQLEQC